MQVERWAGQAQLLAVHDRQLMAVSESLAWERAGGFPEAFVTAHDARVTQSGVRTGDRGRTDFGRGGGVIASVCNPDNWDTIVELDAFKAIDPIGSAFAECAGTDRRHRAAQVSSIPIIEVGC
jgi:hypothetical protein